MKLRPREPPRTRREVSRWTITTEHVALRATFRWPLEPGSRIFCENEPNFRSRRPVEFIDENGGGAGVRLRRPSEAKPKKK